MFSKKSLCWYVFSVFSFQAQHVVYLVPSTNTGHMEKHSESHSYFKEMWACAKTCSMRLEVFKDWHQPAILKDFVHRRLEEAIAQYKKDCAAVGREEDKSYVDYTCRAKMLLHCAVPDQINSKAEAGWRPDHRILAAQALALMIMEHNNKGDQVSIVGLGIGGGQIVAGATALLSDSSQAMKSNSPDSEFSELTSSIKGRGAERPIGAFANALHGMAPFFGPWTAVLQWGADGMSYVARAVEIMKNNTFLWQAAKLPVDFIKTTTLHPGVTPVIEKLYTIGSPVAKETFTPNLGCVKRYYNIYSKMDLRCKFMGQRITGMQGDQRGSFANLSINFVDDLLPAGHNKMLDSTVLARWLFFIEERLQNRADFKFGLDGKILFFKDKAPFYKLSKADSKTSPSEICQTHDLIDVYKRDINNFVDQVSTSAAEPDLEQMVDQEQSSSFDYNCALPLDNPQDFSTALESVESAEEAIAIALETQDCQEELQENQYQETTLCRSFKQSNSDDKDDKECTSDDPDCEIVSKKPSQKASKHCQESSDQETVVTFANKDFAIRSSPMGKLLLEFALAFIQNTILK